MRLGIIGPGAIAADHVQALRSIDGVAVTTVVGRSLESAQRFAEHWGIPAAYDDLTHALQSPLDVVLICSPNATHAEQAQLSLRAGAHVIVEIPAALSLADCEDLLTAATQADRTIQACHTMRSFPAMRRLAELRASGELEVSAINGFFGIPRRDNQGFRGQRSWVDDLLWHHGCHLVDISMWLVSAGSSHDHRLLTGRAHPTFGMTMDISTQFSLPAEVIVSHALSYNVSALTWEVRVTGPRGDFLFRNGDLLDATGGVVVEGGSIRDVLFQDRQLLAHIADGAPSEFTLAAVMPAMRCLHLLAESAM